VAIQRSTIADVWHEEVVSREEDSEHKAIVIDSEDDGEDGRLWVLKEVILSMINCCVDCV